MDYRFVHLYEAAGDFVKSVVRERMLWMNPNILLKNIDILYAIEIARDAYCMGKDDLLELMCICYIIEYGKEYNLRIVKEEYKKTQKQDLPNFRCYEIDGKNVEILDECPEFIKDSHTKIRQRGLKEKRYYIIDGKLIEIGEEIFELVKDGYKKMLRRGSRKSRYYEVVKKTLGITDEFVKICYLLYSPFGAYEMYEKLSVSDKKKVIQWLEKPNEIIKRRDHSADSGVSEMPFAIEGMELDENL